MYHFHDRCLSFTNSRGSQTSIIKNSNDSFLFFGIGGFVRTSVRCYEEIFIVLISHTQASRENYQKEITRHQKDRERLKLELQNQTARYEDRLTELHSVIAELQKKNERKERNTILEEDEDVIIEEDETGNNADYEKLNLNNIGDSIKETMTGHVLPYLSCSTSFVESTVFGIEKSSVSMIYSGTLIECVCVGSKVDKYCTRKSIAHSGNNSIACLYWYYVTIPHSASVSVSLLSRRVARRPARLCDSDSDCHHCHIYRSS